MMTKAGQFFSAAAAAADTSTPTDTVIVGIGYCQHTETKVATVREKANTIEMSEGEAH